MDDDVVSPFGGPGSAKMQTSWRGHAWQPKMKLSTTDLWILALSAVSALSDEDFYGQSPPVYPSRKSRTNKPSPLKSPASRTTRMSS